MFQYPNLADRRNAILDLIEALTKTEATSLITTEMRSMTLDREIQAEEFLAHGVITLHTIVRGDTKSRGIEIEKMRGISHDEQIRPYQILRNGIMVYSKEKTAQGKSVI